MNYKIHVVNIMSETLCGKDMGCMSRFTAIPMENPKHHEEYAEGRYAYLNQCKICTNRLKRIMSEKKAGVKT